MNELTFDRLRDAVRGEVAAFRAVTRLTPAGGPGDKVFPPTYAVADRARTRYALETRRIDGKEVQTVLLDSVASQANRFELALLDGWNAEELGFPVPSVDFSKDEATRFLDRLTVLEVPHRLADALFRDSLLDNEPFRLSKQGMAFTEATPRDATAVFRYGPTGLVFGLWDSTGPKGGLGSKYQRALVSEIVGIGAVPGVKTGSRLDPAGIEKGVRIFQDADEPNDWTVFPEQAKKDKKGNPELFARSAQDKGKPSGINHGNVAPSIDEKAGGVTIDHAVQTTVLSLPALRRLRFPNGYDGASIPRARRREVELAVRSALAALGLAAVAYGRRQGYDLRSRCLLLPEAPLTIEALGRDGGAPEHYSLAPTTAERLLREAGARAADLGFGWEREPFVLSPAPKLVALIENSQHLAAQAGEDD